MLMYSGSLEILAKNIYFACAQIQTAMSEEKILEALLEIHSTHDLVRIEQDDTHILWRWLPAIVFALQGLDEYKKMRSVVFTDLSIVMINPYHAKLHDVIVKSLHQHDFRTQSKNFSFSEAIVARIYGGFPWYESYHRLCKDKDLFGKTGVVVEVRHHNPLDCIDLLLEFKNKHRDSFAKPCEISYADLEYPGKLNVFHTPNHIENVRHIQALG